MFTETFSPYGFNNGKFEDLIVFDESTKPLNRLDDDEDDPLFDDEEEDQDLDDEEDSDWLDSDDEDDSDEFEDEDDF